MRRSTAAARRSAARSASTPLAIRRSRATAPASRRRALLRLEPLLEERGCATHCVGLGRRVGGDALPAAAGIVEIVGGGGVRHDLDVAAELAAALHQRPAAAERHLFVGG